MKSKASFVILAASVLIGTFASTSHAQGEVTATTTTSGAPMTPEQTKLYKPNLVLLVGGSVAFFGSYIPSLIVAGSSQHDGDKNLYIPVAGPWIDLGDRPKCGDGAGRVQCGTEFLNDMLLVVGGVFQAAGVVGIVASFFVPEKRPVSTVLGRHEPQKNFQIHLTPASVARGAPGIAAIGTW